jgi:hypothetical protein
VNSLTTLDGFLSFLKREDFKYFTTFETETGPIINPEESTVLSLNFQRTLDTTVDFRVAYSLLNWLSDTGGLQGMLFLLGSSLV